MSAGACENKQVCSQINIFKKPGATREATFTMNDAKNELAANFVFSQLNIHTQTNVKKYYWKCILQTCMHMRIIFCKL